MRTQTYGIKHKGINMTEEQILGKLNGDLAGARDNQVAQMAIIENWRQECKGEAYSVGHQQTSWGKKAEYSSVVVKLIKKAIESSVPSLVEPFLGSNIVSAKGRDAVSQSKAKVASAVLNYFWNYSVRPEELMEPFVRVLQTDGTVVGKVVWNDGVPGTVLTALDNLTFDPSADVLAKCKFIIEKGKVPISDILSNPEWYGEHTLESLKDIMPASDTDWDVEVNGHDNSFNFDDRARTLVEVNTYYGVMGNDKGEVETVIGIWSDNTLLKYGPSPYPDNWNGLPFVSTVYIPQEGSLYGENIGNMISTDQKVSTSIQRSILRHLDKSTIGQRGYRNGDLDPIEEAKFKNGFDFKYQGTQPNFWEGSFSQINGEVFALQDRTKADVEELLGIGRLNAGLDPRALNSNVSATASSLVNSNAQRRLLLIVRHISSMLEQMFRKWLDMTILNNPDLVVELGGELVSLTGFELDGSYDLVIDVTTDAQKSDKIQNLNMTLQTLGNTKGVPGSISMDVTADLMAAMDNHVLADQLRGIADSLREQEAQPNPMQEIETQMLVQREQAEQAEIRSKAKLNEARAVESFVDMQNASYGL
jgi:hypothetical protein